MAEPAVATSFTEGQSAYRKGQFEQSHKILRPLALRGNARAQFLVGRQYQLGQGVEKNLVKAWIWYRRAEANGHTEAALFRHLLERRKLISVDDLREARRIFGDPVDTATAVARKARPEKIMPEIKARPRSRPVFAAKLKKSRELDLSRAKKKPGRKAAARATPEFADVKPQKATPDYNRQSASRRPARRFYNDDDISEHTPQVIPQRQWRRPAVPAWQHRDWQSRRWRQQQRWRQVRRWRRMQRRRGGYYGHYGGHYGPRPWRRRGYRHW